jgi:hypothetical protein
LLKVQAVEFEKNNTLGLALCRACGGRCCQGSPGVWADPERFFAVFFAGQELTVAQLRERLPALRLVLWEKGGVPVPAPLSLAAGCAFYGLDGCRLAVAVRPCQCLALIPRRETLAQQTGCLCMLPEEFSRDAVRQRWQLFWQNH